MNMKVILGIFIRCQVLVSPKIQGSFDKIIEIFWVVVVAEKMNGSAMYELVIITSFPL